MTKPMQMRVKVEKVSTQRSLADAGCAIRDCGHDHSVLVLSPACHPSAGFEAAYYKSDGRLYMRCKECNTGAMLVQVAHGEDA